MQGDYVEDVGWKLVGKGGGSKQRQRKDFDKAAQDKARKSAKESRKRERSRQDKAWRLGLVHNASVVRFRYAAPYRLQLHSTRPPPPGCICGCLAAICIVVLTPCCCFMLPGGWDRP